MPDVWVFPGGAVDASDGEDEAGYRACAVRELAEEAAIELPADEELVLFSRWITPEVDLDAASTPGSSSPSPPPTRRPSPTASRPPRPAGSSRARALEAQAAGEIVLAFPTVKQLESLLPFRTSDEALAARRPPGPRRAGGSNQPASTVSRPSGWGGVWAGRGRGRTRRRSGSRSPPA